MVHYAAALITGASSGIGEALAKQLPQTTDLLLHGRDEARLEALARSLARPGRRVEIVAADLAVEGGPEQVIAAATNFGIDLLVNNAGIGNFGPFLTADPAREREMTLANVVAPVVITHALLPGMLARARAGQGRAGLVIVASVVGFAPIPHMATYAATKAFDLHWGRALAVELGDEPIDVLTLCPGSTATRFAARAGEGGDDPRGHSPDRVASAALAALGHRKVAVVGFGNRVITVLFKLIPHGIVANAAERATRGRRKVES